MEAWKSLAAQADFQGKNPWLYYKEYLKPSLAKIVGAKDEEVSVMNALTVNLHLLMLSFYRPSPQRYKIIMEEGAFPSDQYAVETQVAHHGLQYNDAVIEVSPRAGEKIIQEQDILNAIEENRNELALLLFGGIHYYTGQLFDIKKITAAVHEAGAIAGWDLAHAAGNVPLHLHEWNVDFAAWCSYKYLNAGPGAAAGFFVHEKFANDSAYPRLGGWWGNDEETRVKMERGFIPKKNASGWNISTAQVFNMVALKASLDIFDKTTMHQLRKKSEALTAYLEFLLKRLDNTSFEIITPKEVDRRGAQLSLHFKKNGKIIHDKMIESGIIIDYREPGVVRVAPAPLYCSFEDCFHFFEILKKIFSA
jgi:kynureninase